MTSYDESTNGLMMPRHGRSWRGAEQAFSLTVELLESRIGELETRLQEQGFFKLNGSAGGEFSRDTLDKLVDLARTQYLKNPLIKRAVNVIGLYVWGQDLSVSAGDDDVKAVIDRFWGDNRATLTGQQASRLQEVELQTTGNIFLALFPNSSSGRVLVRTVPVEEMREIISNPDDRYEPWFYKRQWSQKGLDGTTVQMTALYPDWRYKPNDKPERIGDVAVRWESPICHVKTGAFIHWRWGIPPIYAALDWAHAYKNLLEDDATRSRALTRWAYRITTEGGRSAVAAAKVRLSTTLGSNGGRGSETNPPPVTGSTFVGDKSVGLDPIRLAGAMLDPEHSHPARLMVSAATGIPDTILSGDVDQGTLATAKSLDRPTELQMAEERQMWRDVFTEICQWVIDADIAASAGILRGRQLAADERKVDLSWPDLLERSVTERVQAIVDAATLSGRSLAGTMPRETVARQLMVAIGIDDIDGEITKLLDEWAGQDAKREEMAQRLAKQPKEPTEDDEQDDEREAFVAALRDVREVLRERDH